MSPMQPGIDLQGGVVVRGVAGERDQYRPVESQLTTDPSPGSVAKAFRELNFDDVYVADLDAIAGQRPAWGDLQAIHDAGLETGVDAGVGDWQRALDLVGVNSIHQVVIGLENLNDARQLQRITSEVDPARLVFSLDLKHGQPLNAAPQWRNANPLEIAATVIELGIRCLIVLDLARVGVGQGTGTEVLCEQIKHRWPEVELIGGGGVTCADDVERLVASGLSRVLVASALHDGRITVQ